MVFGVGFKMPGQMLNLFSQERNLNFGGSRISFMYLKLLNYFFPTSYFLHARPFFLSFCLVFP